MLEQLFLSITKCLKNVEGIYGNYEIHNFINYQEIKYFKAMPMEAQKITLDQPLEQETFNG